MRRANHLTPREVQVAALVYEGMTNREIGATVGTTEQVIKNYLRVIFDKLGVWSRLELALYIANHGGDTWREAHSEPEVRVEPELMKLAG
jgi:DNA-binding NarL/FixJ family response regulator